jgi:hypothetical protein
VQKLPTAFYMRHYSILHEKENSAVHYAANVNCNKTHILVQLSDEAGYQIRVVLTKEEALHLVSLITEAVEKVTI